MPTLTKRLIESLKPSTSDFIVWDSKLPGFGVRVKPSGRRSFLVQYRNAGHVSKRLTIGTYPTFGPEAARTRAQKHLQAARDGADPASERTALRKAATVAELAERYLAAHASTKKRPASVAADRTNLRLYVLPRFGRRKAADMTRADMAQLHHDLRDKPIAANRVLALCSKMFNLAERWGLRPDGSNPCRHVERYAERKRERFMSSEELARLGLALAETERTRTELDSAVAAIRLLLFTGARLSEILTLRWEHVDFDRACLRLTESKTGAKVIHLNAPALDVLSRIERVEGSPWVITGAHAGKRLVGLRRPWYRIRAKAGLDDVRLHDLRHSFASVGVAGGLSLPLIGGLLGHTQPATTQRYAHLAADPLKQASDLIAGRIAAAMAAQPAPNAVVRLKRGTD